MNQPLTKVYKIISHSSADKLEAAVSRRIEEGWRPLGGIAVRPGIRPIMVQAMIFPPRVYKLWANCSTAQTDPHATPNQAKP